jgi:molecular chaperone HscB
VNLQTNDFELFGLASAFSQDSASIDSRWKTLQREAHPDKFATHGAAAQRLAMQWSVRINEAYQRLKDPLKRAAYLCELNACPINAENNTAMPAAFLMQQMEWREALDNATCVPELEQLNRQVLAARQHILERCGQLLDADQDYREAAQQVRALMFIERFAGDVENRLDRIDFA